MNLSRLLLSWTVCLLALAVKGQTDSLREHRLQDVKVEGRRNRSFLEERQQGVTVISLQLLDNMPRILGNADPMHYAQLLPGVQTNSEYDAGLHIQGCDNQHNFVGIEGVPLFNVEHALGFFSIFNAPHFQSMSLSRTAPSAASAGRIGGQVEMLLQQSRDTMTNGSLSVGPLSSQATLRLPVGKNQELTLSARVAYINLLYGQWLKFEDDKIRYGFSDYNLTWQWWPDAHNRVWVDAYYGGDRLKNSNGDHAYDVGMEWKNIMAALHWNRETTHTQTKQTIYFTHYDNHFSLNEDNLHVDIPSDISDVAYKGELAIGDFSAGLHLQWHNVQPQSPCIDGFFRSGDVAVSRQHSTESSLFADYRLYPSTRLSAQAGLRATLYNGQCSSFSLDPVASISYGIGSAGKLQLHADVCHQYLFRTGFSNIGLPTEFWFAANKRNEPQYAYGLSASHEVFLLDRMLRVETNIYYKWLRHQVEYSGNIYDFLYEDYDLDDVLLRGEGRNYGLNILVEKRKGRITGWLSYSLGRARRRFDNSDKWYAANHERIHELNVVATYRMNSHWSFGTTAVLASGTPYTAPRQFYLINNNILSEFSEHNAYRLSPYFRVDVSVNYDFTGRQLSADMRAASTKGGEEIPARNKRADRRRSGLNLSLYNVTIHNNDLFYRLKIYENRFALKPYRFMMPILPSINYYYSF